MASEPVLLLPVVRERVKIAPLKWDARSVAVAAKVVGNKATPANRAREIGAMTIYSTKHLDRYDFCWEGLLGSQVSSGSTRYITSTDPLDLGD